MTYLSDLRSSLVDAAHRQHARVEAGGNEPTVRRDPWHHSMHHARAVLVSLALGLAGPAVGAIQVGAPLSAEPQISQAVSKPAIAPATTASRP